jgi:NAD(P)-dependent dehydrogenase (short-subunit alcohol dehydrogenase family)
MSSNAQTRAALVTGASSGLGEAITRRLVRHGWRVGMVARRREKLERLSREVPGTTVIAGDLRDWDFVDKVVESFVSRTGRLDLLVNNAGAPRSSPLEPARNEELDAAFALNVRAAYRLSFSALSSLHASKGSIVNIGSAGVARNIAIDLVYLCTKGALEVMSRGMAKKWAPLGVRVNTVSPGLIATDILRAAGLSPEQEAEHLRSMRAAFQPLPVEGAALDIADAVAFLASPEASFVTGATLHVDGGVSLGG